MGQCAPGGVGSGAMGVLSRYFGGRRQNARGAGGGGSGRLFPSVLACRRWVGRVVASGRAVLQPHPADPRHEQLQGGLPEARHAGDHDGRAGTDDGLQVDQEHAGALGRVGANLRILVMDLSDFRLGSS